MIERSTRIPSRPKLDVEGGGVLRGLGLAAFDPGVVEWERPLEREGIVYARVTVVQGSPDKVEQGIDSFNSEVLPAVKGVAGYKAAFLLVDRETGKGMGISLWETQDALRRGGEAVDAARAATIKAMGANVPPVEEFEVVASDI
jgi:heme-degrading monooxygenase HmoA